MFLLRFCETQEYLPNVLEHWFHTIQKSHISKKFILHSKNGKVKILTSDDLSDFFIGSRFIQEENPTHTQTKYFVRQKKGVLLPIKRYRQFEDRIQKTHLTPLDTLIKEMAQIEDAFVIFRFKPIKERVRAKALKKAKQYWFEPERKFDQWETYGWFSIKLRTILGPLIRISLRSKETLRPIEGQMESLHEREDPRHAILDKLSRPIFKVQIELSHKFNQFFDGFTLPYLGELELTKTKSQMILSAEELTSLLSPPNAKSCSTVLETEKSTYLKAPLLNPLKLPEGDRKRHLYIIGKTGMGKSTAMLNIFQQDIIQNRTIVMLDPHGDLIDDAIKLIPKEREKDTIFFDVANTAYPPALNPLELLPGENAGLKASQIVEMFKTLANGSWGPRLEYILRNTLLLLILAKNTTLLDLPRVLTDPKTCLKFLSRVDDTELHRFFEKEFLGINPATRSEHTASILNKVGPLLSTPLSRNIFGQPKNKFNFQTAFKDKKIILVPLPKGILGEDLSRLFGMIIIALIQNTLMQRAKIPIEERDLVALFIDEFQNFTTATLLSMFSESRKYGLALTVANQYLTQLPEEISDSILGNAGSILSFCVGYEDAKCLAPYFNLIEEDLTELQPFCAYAKFLYNQQRLPLFQLQVDKPQTNGTVKLEQVKKHSCEQIGRHVNQVEEKIKKRYTGNS
ncbi:MAG: DUF87 domain-containing protein [Candidatus Gracilibacteria bacterium]